MDNCEFRIARRALDGILAHARDARPGECCGVLIGKGDEIVDAVGTDNLANDPHRFVLDPKGHIDAEREARGRGLDVIGFYHSHPHSAPQPSPTDLAEASYPDHLYLIVSLRAEPAEVRLFRLDGGNFLEVGFATFP